MSKKGNRYKLLSITLFTVGGYLIGINLESIDPTWFVGASTRDWFSNWILGMLLILVGLLMLAATLAIASFISYKLYKLIRGAI